jgi:thiosulfate/3-mercaptopyruvate sulfurtransferase
MNRDSVLIEADELLTKLGANNLRIYDATILFFRTESDLPTAYQQYFQGHIPGAAFFDHQRFSDSQSSYEHMLLPQAELVTQIGLLGISQDAEVILYAVGALPAATRAWWILRYAGHNNVRVLNGGLAAWTKAGGKLEPGDRQYEATQFKGQPRPGMLASKEEVLQAMGDASICIEYTLPLEVYGGAHIPGSSVISALDLLQGMDTLVSDEAFVSRLQEGARFERIITYCGGGIAATVNAIAHLIAGHENVSVYDGSLLEWMGEGLPLAESASA